MGTEVRFILQYEQKGLDYWWSMLTPDRTTLVGRGIVSDSMWNDFVSSFVQQNGVLNVQLEERRIKCDPK